MNDESEMDGVSILAPSKLIAKNPSIIIDVSDLQNKIVGGH